MAPKVGDIVIYTEKGEQFIGTVLETRELEHHSGENDEPLLHIGFFAPVFQPGPDGKLVRMSIAGTHRQYDLAQVRLDVVHESHSFSEEANKSGYKGVYPGGRWRDCIVSEVPATAEAEVPVETSKKKKKNADEPPVN